MSGVDAPAPWRTVFDNARDPYTARNALGITDISASAPLDAEYIVAADDPSLTNDRVLTDTATITWDLTTPGQVKANAVVTADLMPPQGRLTLTSGTPVMTANPADANPVYYTPYVGDQISLYDGTNMVPTTFAELSCFTTDTSKNPSALGVGKVNDWFVWNDAGTIRLCHGPDWTNDTTRSAGTALVRVKGLWLNAVAITNACAAQRGTYVGTTMTGYAGAATPNWIVQTVLGVGGVASFLGVWNAYNRVDVATVVSDATDSWLLTAATAWRPSNGSTNMRCTFVRGLAEDSVTAQFTCPMQVTGSSQGALGVGLDTTTTYTGTTWWSYITGAWYTGVATYNGTPGIGIHYLQAMEYNHTTAGTYFSGDSGAPSYIQNGLTVQLRA